MPDLHINTDTHFLLANVFWGAVASGYVIYGWRQKSAVPLLCGVLMTVASFYFDSALLMSIFCLGLMGAAYWAYRRMG